MLNLDVSGSMDWRNCVGCDFLTPAAASFALAMITMKVEPNCSVFAFGRTLQNIDHLLKRDMTIREAIQMGRSVGCLHYNCFPHIFIYFDNGYVNSFVSSLSNHNTSLGLRTFIIVLIFYES